MILGPPESAPFLRRVGVIGDIHGEDAALAKALDFFASNGAWDALLCTGDLPEKQGVGDSERCCRQLEEAGVLTVRGNHDRWYFENAELRTILGFEETFSETAQAFLKSLPPFRVFDTPAGRLLLCHGIGRDDTSGIYRGGEDSDIEKALERYGLPGPYRFMLSGHTHQRMVRPLANGLTLINAGTLQRGKEPCLSTIDFDLRQIQFYDITPIAHAIRRAETISLPVA